VGETGNHRFVVMQLRRQGEEPGKQSPDCCGFFFLRRRCSTLSALHRKKGVQSLNIFNTDAKIINGNNQRLRTQ